MSTHTHDSAQEVGPKEGKSSSQYGETIPSSDQLHTSETGEASEVATPEKKHATCMAKDEKKATERSLAVVRDDSPGSSPQQACWKTLQSQGGKRCTEDTRPKKPHVTHEKGHHNEQKIGLEGLEDNSDNLQKIRANLPIYAMKSEVVKTVQDNQVCVILGETGAGKSTQLVQYLLSAGMSEHGAIVCTQPNKVSAVSLAERVSEERGERVGQVVGCRVGMKTEGSEITPILFTTDQWLLRGCSEDPLFRRYSCVVIDEAHERSIHTDLLLGMIKKCLPLRPDLKVVITSATIDPVVFVNFFQKGSVLRIPGREIPVVVVHKNCDDDPFQDYVEEAVVKAKEVHENEDEGGILVFLTSGFDTEKAVKLFQSRVDQNSVTVLQLHGRQHQDDQKKVFRSTEPGQRKVVFTTNYAETSITIPGIKYVIDTGMVKTASYNHHHNMQALTVQCISKSSAEQRKGRAGRTKGGKCYRLYTKKAFEEMEPAPTPEILRKPLSLPLLQLLQFGVGKDFPFLEDPPEIAVRDAMNQLETLGASKDGELTEIGHKLARLTLDPRLGKFLLLGIERGIGYECLVLVAMCTVGGSFFFHVGTKENKGMAMKQLRFCEDSGDLLTLLAVYKEWSKAENQNGWCGDNNINPRSLETARENLKELQYILEKDLKLEIKDAFTANENICKELTQTILECFSSNLCFFSGHANAGYMLAASPDRIVHLHPSSVLRFREELPKWVVYESILSTTKPFMMNVTAVDEQQVLADRGIHVDFNLLKTLSFKKVKYEGIGKMTMNQIVGPRFKLLEKLKDNIKLQCETSVEFEPKRDEGSLEVYCIDTKEEVVSKSVDKHLQSIKRKLADEKSEHSIETNSATGVILSKGCSVEDVLLPSDFRSVQIKNVPKGYDVAAVQKVLSEYGSVTKITQFNSSKASTRGNETQWGKATFQSAKDAKRAVEEQKRKIPFRIHPDINPRSDERRAWLRVSVQWCRRPRTKDIAFVSFENPKHAQVALKKLSKAEVNGKRIIVSPNKHESSQLFLRFVPKDISEDQLLRCLDAYLDESCRIIKVSMPREKVKQTPKSALDSYAHSISAVIKDAGVQDKDYSVKLLPVKETTFFFTAHIFIKDALNLYTIQQALEKQKLNGYKVNVQTPFQVTRKVPEDVYDVIKGLLQRLADEEEIEMKREQLPSGHWLLHFSVHDARALARVLGVVRGTSEHLSEDDFKIIVSPSGRRLVSKLQSQNILVKTDYQLCRLDMFRATRDIEVAKSLVDDFLEQGRSLESSEISLKGEGIPNGLMKKLLKDYGCELDILQSECEAFILELNIKKHSLIFMGENESLYKLNEILEKVKTSMPAVRETSNPMATQDCPVCFCPIKGPRYILELCGHVYCKECITLQVQTSVRSKQFPIRCAAENCREYFLVAEAKVLLCCQEPGFQSLIQSALDGFMQVNKDKYRYCLSPDCQSIYRTSETREVFECPECRDTICTTCHESSHQGLTCAQNESKRRDTDYNLTEWVNADPSNHALCPECKTPIEKNQGCMHVECIACKTHICWHCKESFESSAICYEHLGTVHGSYM